MRHCQRARCSEVCLVVKGGIEIIARYPTADTLMFSPRDAIRVGAAFDMKMHVTPDLLSRMTFGERRPLHFGSH
jgi:hypothetical protein